MVAQARGSERWWIPLAASALLAGCAKSGDRPAEAVPPPHVVASLPAEGQVGVPSGLVDVEVRFDRPMDVGIGEAPLHGEVQLVPLGGTWSSDATAITLSAQLEPEMDYRLDLRSFRDRAGRSIELTQVVLDGFLDFRTARDDQPPHATASDPPEGAVDLDPLLDRVSIVFSEPMDAAVVEVTLDRSGDPGEIASGIWSDDGRTFTVLFEDYLPTGTPLRLDLSGLADRAGNLVDTTHPYLGDGALDFTLHAPDGDDCDDPMVASQATIGNGFHSWYLPPRRAQQDRELLCAGALAGGDVVIAYDKTSGRLAEGGALMHVVAAGEAGAVALEITSGACGGAVEKCMGARDSWEIFLDAPAGRYWIWVADPEAGVGDFSGAFLSIEEVPATAPQAEGEGCFAPMTIASPSHQPPLGPDDPHVFTVASIDAFDAAPTTDTAAMSCGGALPDIPGVDAVIEFPKAQASTILYVEIDNGMLDAELRSGCDPLDPASIAHYCGLRAPSFTAAAPAGPAYLWLSTPDPWWPLPDFDGTFPTTEVRIREIAAAPGEARAHPEPLAGSGPIAPTSTLGLEVPSCFPSSVDVHWYSHVASGTLLALQGDVPAPIAIFAAQGPELACATDASSTALGAVTSPGATMIIAVESTTALGHLTLEHMSYSGVGGAFIDLGVVLPGSFPNFPDGDGMAVGTQEIFLGSTQQIFSFPKTGAAAAVSHDAAEGLGSAQLGFDIAFAAGRLFSVDSTQSTTTSRLWAVHEEDTSLWGPTPWDDPAAYPEQTRVRAMTYDGGQLVLASHTNGPGAGVQFFAVDTLAPSSPVSVGSNLDIHGVDAIAADASYFYVMGLDGGSNGGIFRIDRANPSGPAFRLAAVEHDDLEVSLVVDDEAAAKNLYAIDGFSRIHVLARPGQAMPIAVGNAIPTLPRATALAFDASSGTLYLYDELFGRVVAVP